MLASFIGACGDLDLVGDVTLSTSELLILPLQPAAPAVSDQSFYVVNSRLTVRQLRHSDAFNTLYVELRFPPQTLASLNQQPVSAQDSVLVTVQPLPGRYGLTLSPQGLEFNSDAAPSVTVSFARYGDLSVADGSATYETPLQYANALELWFEITPGRWQAVRASGATPSDAVVGPLDTPGNYVLAAPR